MRDVVFVAVVIAFFAVAAVYVRGCAAIVGLEASEESRLPYDPESDRSEVPA